MQVQEHRQQARWAPWWLYVIALLVTNQARTQLLQPDDLPFWLEVVIGAGSMALVATLVTVAWRAVRR
ncbi:MAG TPA: hypothetical protein VFC13_12040 [Actinomycetes bacterium]|jgi:hypothetical protein|nr:hypothetical protein [Actinomycetes bacterium]